MAVTSGSFNTDTCDGRYLTFSWERTSYSIANNTSTISWKLVGAGASGWVTCGNFKVVIAGSTVYSSADRINVYAGTVIASGTKVINHSSNGAGSFSASAEAGIYYVDVNCDGSGSWTLPTIPRASSFSVSNGTLGTALALTVTKQDSSFTHKITYKCGSASGEVCAYTTSSTSVSWGTSNGNTLALCSQNVTGTSVSVIFTLQTYSGSTAIGSAVTKTITMAIPASVKPTVAISVSDPTGYASTFGGYVQGQSKMQIDLSITLAYGSAIQDKTITADGNSYKTASSLTPVIASSENLTVNATVIDGRSRTGTASKAVTVIPYSKPSITQLAVHRCNADGAENSTGSYAVVTYSYAITELSSKNAKTITLKYKKSTDTDYTSVTLTSAYSATSATYIFAAADDASYDVVLSVADTFTTSTRSTSVSTAEVIMHYGAAGNSIAFGKLSEKTKAVEFGWDMLDKFGALVGNGLAAYEGGGDTGIDPDTTLEGLCVTSHTNAPQGLGTFYYIWTVFYNTKSTSAARAQIAFPYKKSGSMYHRYYADGAWSSWSRYMTADEVFPVNSVVILYSHQSPAEIYGGTWHRMESRFLWGTPSTGTIGATGGATTHGHDTSGIYAAIGAFTSETKIAHTTYAADFTANRYITVSSKATNASSAMSRGTKINGSLGLGSSMPPYVNVAIWRRIA